MIVDRWGVEVAGERSSVDAWNRAWGQFVHFTGDPVATLADATERDGTFVMGPVFTGVYAVLGGSPLDAPVVADSVERARRRDTATSPHVAALETLARGDFTEAAVRWAEIGVTGADLAAVRFAHDVFLHVGDARRRIDSERAAWAVFDGHPDRHVLEGMLAFSYNEVGDHTRAEEHGRAALDQDSLDLWARHALAHVYEENDDSGATMALLRDTTDVWADQDLLATHVWWHLALRLLATGAIDDVLAIADEMTAGQLGTFGLCDLTSLLWRAELAGHDVGPRWDAVADRWDVVFERHTCGFIDLHAAIGYLRRPDHPGAPRWFDGLDARPRTEGEIDEIFDEVAAPLIGAFRARATGDTATFGDTVDRLGHDMARIGGSNAQRALITLTREADRS